MNRGRNRGNNKNFNRNEKKFTPSHSVDENNPIIRSFRGYADELDDKHDRFERIVKHSRDITVESKRLIFLLHTIDMRNPSSVKILSDALIRLNSLCTNAFCSIAKELKGRDPYQYARAYSCGLQEFIEALSYYEYLANNAIDSIDWNVVQQKLSHTIQIETSSDGTVDEEYKCLVQPIEFMLGLADLSGEIMRKCINALGCGDIETCRKACNFIQHLYSGYLSLGSSRNRELTRKMHTMYQSVLKVEKVCYNVKVRGSEAAIWSSSDAHAHEKETDDTDEGFVHY